jgi:hypothetical protein
MVGQESYTQSPLFSITMQSVREVRRNAEASGTKGNSGHHVEGMKDHAATKGALWPRGFHLNVLTELDAKDPVTGYCEFRNIACRIRKAHPA